MRSSKYLLAAALALAVTACGDDDDAADDTDATTATTAATAEETAAPTGTGVASTEPSDTDAPSEDTGRGASGELSLWSPSTATRPSRIGRA